MAYVATITRQKNLEAGFTLYEGTIAADNSYANGGEVVDASGNAVFDLLFAQAPGYVCSFDPSTQKMTVYRQKDPGNAGGADIALVEVANAVDLSAVPFRFLAVGA